MLLVLVSVFYLVIAPFIFDFDVVLVLYSLADVPHFVKEAGFVLEFDIMLFFILNEFFHLRLVVFDDRGMDELIDDFCHFFFYKGSAI